MNPESESPFIAPDVAATAADWARRRALGLSVSERERFKAWLAAAPVHRIALAKASPNADDCDWAWEAGVVDDVVSRLERRRVRRRRRRAFGTGLIAALLVVGFIWQRNRQGPYEELPAGPALVIVAPERQVLPDGSVVVLKEGADISADYSETSRRLTLTSGTAHFQVAKDPDRPFVVFAGGVEARAVGTAFSVQLGTASVEVLVTEGQVSVSAPDVATASALAAGNRVTIPVASPAKAAHPEAAPVIAAVESEELAERTAWRLPKLEFNGAPLREIVAQMNQHNERQFVIADPSIGEMRVSGVLRSDKMEILAEMIETDLPIRVERTAREIILYRR